MKTTEILHLIFPAIIITFYSFNSFAQIYSGQLIDKESGQPIPYANIGIIGKNIVYIERNFSLHKLTVIHSSDIMGSNFSNSISFVGHPFSPSEVWYIRQPSAN